MNLNYVACVLKMFNKDTQKYTYLMLKEVFSAKLNKIENAIGILSKKGIVMRMFSVQFLYLHWV